MKNILNQQTSEIPRDQLVIITGFSDIRQTGARSSTRSTLKVSGGTPDRYPPEPVL